MNWRIVKAFFFGLSQNLLLPITTSLFTKRTNGVWTKTIFIGCYDKLPVIQLDLLVNF